jgi:SNF2 family DNA or RNA helicase
MIVRLILSTLKEALLELKELEQHPRNSSNAGAFGERSRPHPLNMSEHVATLRRLIGTAKVGAAVEYILDIVEHSQEKLIVFCYHKHVMDSLEEALQKKNIDTVRVDGSCSRNKEQ